MNELLIISDKDPKTGESLKRRRLEWIFGYSYMNSLPADTQLKIGLDSADQKITAPIYTYKSMATYDPDVKKPLLQLLFSHQVEGNRHTEGVKVLEVLIQLLAEDPEVQAYFASLPGVTYQYARYTDWIKAFLYSRL